MVKESVVQVRRGGVTCGGGGCRPGWECNGENWPTERVKRKTGIYGKRGGVAGRVAKRDRRPCLQRKGNSLKRGGRHVHIPYE